MKIIKIFVLLCFYFPQLIPSQTIFTPEPYSPNVSPGELLIINQTTYWREYYGGPSAYKLIIKIIPSGALFTGNDRYSPLGQTSVAPPFNNKITGGIFELDTITSLPTRLRDIKINLDDSASTIATSLQLDIGLSLYKIEFWNSDTTELLDYVYIDWRNSEFRNNLINDTVWSDAQDIRIDYFSNDSIMFRHYPHYGIHYFYNIKKVNRHIKMWELYGTSVPPYPYSKGQFVTDVSSNGIFLKLPINANQFNGNLGHENPGDLGMNLEINHNVTTRDTLISALTNILIPANGYLKINSGKTFNMITASYPSGGSNNLVVQDSAKLILNQYSNLIIDRYNSLTLQNKGEIQLGWGSEIRFKDGSSFCNEGGLITSDTQGDNPGGGRIYFEKGYVNVTCGTTKKHEFRDSAKLVLLDSSVLEVPDSVTLSFTGSGAGLIMNPNSKLKMGVGSKIVFDSSASFIAKGATFTSIDSTLKWEGIFLSNTEVDSIVNCTFSNAKTALTITNTANNYYKNRVIKNNTFNIPFGGVHKGIYGENNYKILLQDNVFNMPVYNPQGQSPVQLEYIGVYLKNSSTAQAGGGEVEQNQASNYSLNIIHNTFNNGCASVILANYVSNHLPYNVNRNTFNSAASVNLIGIQIDGSIVNNNFTSDDVPLGIHLISSSPDMFNNTIESGDVALHLSGHCYPNLAPYVSASSLVWTGGSNVLTTKDGDNIQLSSSGNVFTDWGNNNFNTINSSAYHIYGWMDTTINAYYSRNNCWNSADDAIISLTKNNTSLIVPAVFYNAGYNCSTEESATGWDVEYLGNGIYDSVKLSSDNTNEERSEEEILYFQAKTYISADDYPAAIASYKYLIDSDTAFEYSETSVGELYNCYVALDTCIYYDYRYDLYMTLINYLEVKIDSGNYGKDFNDVAYAVILDCYAALLEYSESADGYGLLAIYHPDPNIRLAASWNYEEIQALIGSGGSGGEKQLQFANDKLQIEELKEIKELQRLDEIINNDPLMSKLKKSYDKISKEKKEKTEKQLRGKTKNSKTGNADTKDQQIMRRSMELDKMKEDRAKRNIFEARSASIEEKQKRRVEDLALTTLDIRNEINNNENAVIPLEYKLEQNYPNPFNPTSIISYSLSGNDFVSLKIYDVLGKEIMTLVNEKKNAGRYSVTFDGSNLANGVYFYKIEAGSFTSTRRMMLIK